MKRLLALTALSLLALSGCTSAPESEPAETEASAPKPSPTPTVEAATPEQVASVLAAYETDWREVIDESGACRFTWTLDDTPTGKLEGMACYLTEQTIGNTASIVIRDWEKLVIPESMASLVSETEAVLQDIADIDLRAACGTDAIPSSSDECSSALGSRNIMYGLLESKLNAWKPYL